MTKNELSLSELTKTVKVMEHMKPKGHPKHTGKVCPRKRKVMEDNKENKPAKKKREPSSANIEDELHVKIIDHHVKSDHPVKNKHSDKSHHPVKNGHPTKSDYLPVNTDYLDPEEVMCKVNDKYILRRYDLSTLKDGEWLNDKVS